MKSRQSLIRLVSSLILLFTLLTIVATPGNVEAAALFGKVSPTNGATGQATSLTLKWNAAPSNPYGYGQYYKYCYYKSGSTCDFNGIIYTTQFAISGLSQATTYYWQIEVVNCKDSGCTQLEKTEADSGQKWSFTTAGGTPPGAFSKSMPADNDLNIASRILSWQSSTGATSYQVCYTPNTDDANCAYLGAWKDVGNTTTYTIPVDSKFIWGNRYYWQVRASNAGGTTLANGGTWWSFTSANLIGKVTLISPDGVINTSTPTYRWNELSGATWYYLWITRPAGDTIFIEWYEAPSICSGGTCAVTPAITLGAGDFNWKIQAYNSTGYGPWSNALTFNTPIPTVPGTPTLVSPKDNIGTNYSPTFTWIEAVSSADVSEQSVATQYQLWISNPSGKVFSAWYQASAICNSGSCSVTPAITLKGGNYTWWAQAWNSVGSGPWSAAMSFSLIQLGAATLVSPTGDIGMDYNPTYTWNQVGGSTWYYLWVDGPTGTVIQQWYRSAEANCNGTTCSVTPTTKLSGGAHTWWIQTWNGAGYGPWSTGKSFSTFLVGAATLISPTGNIDKNFSPTYTWNEVTGSTWYYLWVDGPTGTVIQNWYRSTEANCNGTTCSVTPATTLGGGTHTWWIQAYSSAGYGPWSSGMSFSTTILPLPSAATLVSPTGPIGTDTPTYTWNEVGDSTWYYLWVGGPGGPVIQQWYRSAEANCNGTTCSVTPATALGSGIHTWWIQTWNSTGDGPWSSQMDFLVP